MGLFEAQKDDIVYMDNVEQGERQEKVDVHNDVLQQAAIDAEAFELGLSNWEALRLYRMGIFWAFMASLSVVMEGYDYAVTGTYTALPVFRQYSGNFYPAIDEWQIPGRGKQLVVGQASLIGNLIGIPFGAFLVERIGYRHTLIVNYLAVLPFVAIQAFARNLGMLFAGGLLLGIPFGVFSTLACGYASEVCPPKLRGYLTGYINICWELGLLFGTGIGNAILRITSQWGFRAGYMTQWIWPLPLIIFMWMAPDSPWWLVRKNRVADAEKSLKRLTSPSIHNHVPSIVQNMVRTHRLETDLTKGASWLDCFRGADLRRTEIACMAFANQTLCGDPFSGQQIYFLQQAGMSDSLAFMMGCLIYVGNFLGCFIAYGFMARVGRRTLYLWGMSGLAIGLLLIGGLQKVADHDDSNAKWGMAGVLVVANIYRVVTIGPACYAVVSESSSSRLRNKTIGLARMSYQLVGLVANFVEPQLINPSALNLKGYTAWCWAPVCFLGGVWCYFRLPEFKDRSFYELDVLFERKVPTRKFSKTEVEALADDHLREEKQVVQSM